MLFLINLKFRLADEDRHMFSFASLRLSDYLVRPGIIEQDNNFDELARGMTSQPQANVDQHYDQEVTIFCTIFFFKLLSTY